MPAFLIVNTQVFPIKNSKISIGREMDNDLVIHGAAVSRQHAEIKFEDEQYILVDLDSTSGTFVNGIQITESTLNSGDSIMLADTPIVFVDDAPPISRNASMPTGSLDDTSVDQEDGKEESAT